ncbi:glucokinase [Asticcacaulis sp. BYS171W]|uniref:Glucokinase n=1 Tax=Asticcacaulis aquaticus TaxID=2984212 RepID=A0ABT5HSB5_9CAUL|nr:glucokinase [Asticcacaulis aquaticus]MDC7682949.1 glucokinase [Asticcacaulis aquaticus]
MASVLLSDLSNSAYMKLALAHPGERPELSTLYPCKSLEEFNGSVVDFLEAHGNPDLIGAAVSACGWEVGGGLSMPNHGYRMERSDLRELLNIQRLHIVNDCVSRAMAVERLFDSEVIKVCGGQGEDGLTKALIGSGRGLGVAGIVLDDLGNPTVLPCEGGHADLATVSAREDSVFAHLEAKYGHVSRERVASISGLAELYEILGRIDDGDTRRVNAAEVVALAHTGDRRAKEAIGLCQGWLAAMASDTALMLGARSGVYLSGELLELIGDLIDWPAFEARFTDKGRLRSYMQDIPVYLTRAADLELIGLTTLFG